jgi:retinol-binding protein 3
MVADHVGAYRGARCSVALGLFLSALSTVLPTAASAQETETTGLDAARRQDAVNRIADLLIEQHLSPDVGEACAAHLRARLAEGAYDDISDPTQFAVLLTRDLHTVDDDGHLRVEAGPPNAFLDHDRTDSEEVCRRMFARFRRDNFGFRKIEVLDDNVGYLELRAFAPPEVGGDTAVAAMAFLANCDAVILDLRENGGGSGGMVQLIASYFFAQPKHLNSGQTRGEDLIEQSWTQAYVPGKRMADKPLFILTSRRTGSAAEAFTYDLKHHGRATVIGETTGGSEHSAFLARVGDMFNVVIPHGRSIHPVTGTGWERVGVKPDIDVAASQALARARVEAARVVRERAATNSTGE